MSDENEVEQPQRESTRDTMARIFEESLKDSDPGDETSTATPDLDTEAPKAQEGRARDEHGRFAKKNSGPEGSEQTGTQPAQGTHEEHADPSAAPIDAPLSVPGELKASWAQLPRTYQEFIARREQETQDSLRTQGRQVHELNEVLKEHAPDWEVRGITPAQVMRQHLAWSKQFEANPVDAMFRLGALYGVTPQHVAQALQTQSQAPQAGYQQQQQYTQQLPPQMQQALERIEQFEARQSEAEIAQKTAFAESQYSVFANAKDANGNLLRPYWAEAYPIMQRMATGLREQYPNADPQEFLDIAYNAACYADAGLRQKSAADSEKARQQRERQQAEQARRMGSSVRGAPNGAAGAAKRFGSVQETMRAAYEGKIS